MTRNTGESGAGCITNNTPAAKSPTRISALTNRCAPNTTARLPSTSESLPQARMLPDSVTPPISTDSVTVMAVKVELSPYSAAHPTSRLAAPPVPLKSATISGMEVIATSRAAKAPITAPTSIATAIQCHSRMPFERSVTTTAISMPAAERALPRRAVAGEPSIFRPKTKSAAATM